jgi:hypothetical protein
MLPNDTDLVALRAQAADLAALMRAEVPMYGRTHRPLKLEPSAPAAIAALWESIGWADVFSKKQGLESPELQSGEAAIAERMEDYRSWGAGFKLTPADLPSPRRLVEDDGQGVAFLITDESAGGIDAPILGVLADKNKIVRGADSYVRWCGNALVKCAFSRWFQADFAFTPSAKLVQASDCPWPLLTPAALRLAPDVYAIPVGDHGTKAPHQKGRYRLAYRSLESLIGFLETAELDSIEPLEHVSDRLEIKGPASSILLPEETVRWLPSPSGKRLGIGSFAGKVAVIWEVADKTQIYVRPRYHEELRAIRDARLRGS